MAVPLREVVRCPECGSADVVYSCEPKCCFNHVCAECKTTFQITTEKTGRTDGSGASPTKPESGDPTTSCAVCHGLRVGALSNHAAGDETLLVCGDCHAVLTLRYEDIASGRVVSG